ncbi:MAG: hypothetical protein GF384_04030 [Elusimicrobia bacterium]|nr:hypothetical protein [Elusimicrobiota bacterium]
MKIKNIVCCIISINLIASGMVYPGENVHFLTTPSARESLGRILGRALTGSETPVEQESFEEFVQRVRGELRNQTGQVTRNINELKQKLQDLQQNPSEIDRHIVAVLLGLVAEYYNAQQSKDTQTREKRIAKAKGDFNRLLGIDQPSYQPANLLALNDRRREILGVNSFDDFIRLVIGGGTNAYEELKDIIELPLIKPIAGHLQQSRQSSSHAMVQRLANTVSALRSHPNSHIILLSMLEAYDLHRKGEHSKAETKRKLLIQQLTKFSQELSASNSVSLDNTLERLYETISKAGVEGLEEIRRGIYNRIFNHELYAALAHNDKVSALGEHVIDIGEIMRAESIAGLDIRHIESRLTAGRSFMGLFFTYVMRMHSRFFKRQRKDLSLNPQAIIELVCTLKDGTKIRKIFPVSKKHYRTHVEKQAVLDALNKILEDRSDNGLGTSDVDTIDLVRIVHNDPSSLLYDLKEKDELLFKTGSPRIIGLQLVQVTPEGKNISPIIVDKKYRTSAYDSSVNDLDVNMDIAARWLDDMEQQPDMVAHLDQLLSAEFNRRVQEQETLTRELLGIIRRQPSSVLFSLAEFIRNHRYSQTMKDRWGAIERIRQRNILSHHTEPETIIDIIETIGTEKALRIVRREAHVQLALELGQVRADEKIARENSIDVINTLVHGGEYSVERQARVNPNEAFPRKTYTEQKRANAIKNDQLRKIVELALQSMLKQQPEADLERAYNRVIAEYRDDPQTTDKILYNSYLVHGLHHIVRYLVNGGLAGVSLIEDKLGPQPLLRDQVISRMNSRNAMYDIDWACEQAVKQQPQATHTRLRVRTVLERLSGFEIAELIKKASSSNQWDSNTVKAHIWIKMQLDQAQTENFDRLVELFHALLLSDPTRARDARSYAETFAPETARAAQIAP